MLVHGRCWGRVWSCPELVPKSGDRGTMPISDPSQCLKSP